MPNPNYETLKDAIARNCGAVLSLPSAGMIRHHKTRFLAEAENGFWIEGAPEAERHLVEALDVRRSASRRGIQGGERLCRFRRADPRAQERFQVNDELRSMRCFFPSLTAIASCSGGRLIA